MRRARTVCVPDGTPPIVKLPSSRVMVARRVPSTTILTPAIGCRVALSITCPVMTPVGCCALSRVVGAAMHKQAAANRRVVRWTTDIGGTLHKVGMLGQPWLAADAEGREV